MSGPSSTRAWLGLGGNLGDPEAAMGAALRALDDSGEASVAAVSAPYRTPPWGVTDQPDFLNAVAAVDTTLSARQLLDLCLSIEQGLKRVRMERWGPRIIDVDILAFGGERIEEPGLQIPHPRMGERAFVILPLCEIEPELLIDGRTVADIAETVDRAGIVRLPRDPDWWKGR